MKIVELIPREHSIKIGDKCGMIEPNVLEDSLFMFGDKPVGFYMAQIPEELRKFAEIANVELNSERVPKSLMKRSSGLFEKEHEVLQYSTIIGAIPPKPHMKRSYASMSSVHSHASAQPFIKSMWLLCKAAEELVRQIMPEQFEFQLKCIAESVPPKFRFGRLFTSSISNFNIAAGYHRDTANLEGCVNVIITKRLNSIGGNTTVPDYGATVNSGDNSILVYPAWRNVHAVTPIIPLAPGGYRNSLVFYPLKAFKNLA